MANDESFDFILDYSIVARVIFFNSSKIITCREV